MQTKAVHTKATHMKAKAQPQTKGKRRRQATQKGQGKSLNIYQRTKNEGIAIQLSKYQRKQTRIHPSIHSFINPPTYAQEIISLPKKKNTPIFRQLDPLR